MRQRRTCKIGDELLLWCDGSPNSDGKKKQKSNDAIGEPASKRERARKEEITKELQEKHGEAWSIPQYRLWARMEHNDQHNSLDVPPSIPMFNNTPSKPHRRDSLTNALTSAATAEIFKGSTATATASPGKRARVSGQYFEHLEKLSRLHKFCLM